MANLDSRFICTSDVDSYFVDNATGLPMSGGIVTFYSDVNRTVLKPVYQLSGTPGNYTYSVLQNPLTLSSSGTYQDAFGNNIAVYYYPFTGTPADNTGVQELYYVVVVNSGLVPQLVRQGWPQAAGSGVTPVSDNEIENFIPNGQFLSHNNIVSITEPPITQYAFGSETVDSQAIAQGGWNFVYTDATTAVFNNSFSQIPSSGGWGINSFPKFVFNFNCTSFNANALTRDLRIQWPDVNKFSSGNPPGTVPYTLFFDAKSNDGNSYTFSLYQIYYFGSSGNGGSPSNPISNLIATITVGPSQTFVSHNIQGITFPANQGTIGANGDDYIALSIRGPASGWNAAFSDFAMIQGNETLLTFPVQTNDEMLSRGVAGWMPTPNPDGSDLYLPLILTPQGMTFDHTQIGYIFASPYSTAQRGELLMDGSSYTVSGYSSDGIPYRRLFNKIFTSSNIAFWGSGANYVNAYTYTPVAADLILMTNKVGSQTAPADGTNPTGFAFSFNTPGATSRDFDATANLSAVVIARCKTLGACTSVSAGTSGMSVADLTNTAATNYTFTLTALTAAALGNGAGTALYFDFHNTTTGYRLWFLTATETAPAAGGNTLVEVKLDINAVAPTVAAIIANTINAFQTDIVVCTSGATIPAGSFFTYQANGITYSPWYKVNGIGSAPSSANPIEVDIASIAVAGAVAAATQIAINSQFMAIGDYRGLFLRGNDPNSKFDNINTERGSNIYNFASNAVNTIEPFLVQSHNHTIAPPNITIDGASANTFGKGGGGTPDDIIMGFFGNYETRPINADVTWVIKY